MTNRTLVIVNATGRQGASLARVASAVGHHVRAHITTKLSEKDGAVAKELRELNNIEIVQGSLEDDKLISKLFVGARRAFINTISWGDEVAIGKALADAAKKAGVQHYVYSSMPDHAVFNQGWPSLPLWSCKFTVENYIRQVRSLALARALFAAASCSNSGKTDDYRLASQPPSFTRVSTTTISPAFLIPSFV